MIVTSCAILTPLSCLSTSLDGSREPRLHPWVLKHWTIVQGLLRTKWDSVVVVDRVVILEAGHCTALHYLHHRDFSFLSDVYVGVDGCADSGTRERSPVWMRDGDPVKWVIATGRTHKGETSTNANMRFHTHKPKHKHKTLHGLSSLCSNC